MPRRRRWKPVRGTGSRIYDPVERLAVAALDLPGRLAFGAGRRLGLGRTPALDPAAVRDVLVLRLDRIGDVLMSRDALADLRAAFPAARMRLAVGRWSQPLAASLPVDEVLVWSAPWVGRASEGAQGLSTLLRAAWSLRATPPDLAVDLQGDVRAAILMWLSGARIRVGYANTGGGYLLTHVVALDETVAWPEQNRRAVAVFGGSGRPPDPLTAGERAAAGRRLAALGIAERRPLVGVHPSGGRSIKQWAPERWSEVAGRLQREFGATIVITGSTADAPLARRVGSGLAAPAIDLTGQLDVREVLALIGALDLFLSPDTGPAHMACAVGTRSVAVFGPSDPVRYFSGGSDPRHAAVRPELWCAPCNLIRRPPRECQGPQGPECLSQVSVDAVYREAARLLRDARGARP